MTSTHKNLKIVCEKFIGKFGRNLVADVTVTANQSCTEMRQLDKTVLCCVCTIALSKIRGFR